MKPFLILQFRPVDRAADGEFEAFLKYGGLKEDEVHRVRMEQDGTPEINLDDYSAVIIGGGPSNVSDKEEKKSAAQKRFEKQLEPMIHEIVERDFPCLGACLGLGFVTQFGGGKMKKGAHVEELNAFDIEMTAEGERDELLKGLANPFSAISAHKESCVELPEGAVVLAKTKDCPVHMYRIKQNVYATQFHPELDGEGTAVRIDVYRNDGYFPAEEAEPLIEYFKGVDVTAPMEIMKRFVDRYRQD